MIEVVRGPRLEARPRLWTARRAVLDRVVAMPLATWNYKEQDDSIRHMGPMAQDFHAAFGLGVSDKLIDTVDPDGVALAAIQGLNESTLERGGNAARGRDVFRKTCVACHKAEGVGHDLGPNLATFKHRGPQAILASVIDPNRELNPQYATYSVITRDGRVLSGMLTAETPTSITLTREEGKHDTVLRNEIEELRGNNISLMPEGLEKNIDQQSMADLIAYLMTLE